VPAVRLPDEVRAHAAAVAAGARAVRIDRDRIEELAPDDAPAPAPDHGLTGAGEAEVAGYLLTVGAINFGSGWFPTLEKRRAADGRPVSGATTVAWAVADRVRAHGPWTNAELRAMRTEEIAATLGQRADHELMALYAQALRSLGAFLGERSALDLVAEASGSAVALAADVAGGMGAVGRPRFYKRAQSARDATSRGPGGGEVRRPRSPDDLRRQPRPAVLRCEGVLVYDELLADHVDRGPPAASSGPWEREIRACAAHAGAALAWRLGLKRAAL
jgi:hypothetical protein